LLLAELLFLHWQQQLLLRLPLLVPKLELAAAWALNVGGCQLPLLFRGRRGTDLCSPC
jgi:hypothetical protein